jgi:hypothetical protein
MPGRTDFLSRPLCLTCAAKHRATLRFARLPEIAPGELDDRAEEIEKINSRD